MSSKPTRHERKHHSRTTPYRAGKREYKDEEWIAVFEF